MYLHINRFETLHYLFFFKYLKRSLNYCALSSRRKKRFIDELLHIFPPFVVLDPVSIIAHINATEHRNDDSSEVCMEKKHTKKETVKIINKEKTKSNLIRLNACLKLQEALNIQNNRSG